MCDNPWAGAPIVGKIESKGQQVIDEAKPTLFGRDKLLAECSAKLKQRPILLLYGMRGNGKTSLLDALAKQAPLAGKECLRVTLHADSSPNDIFRQLAWSLGEQDEHPQAPTGDAAAIRNTLLKKYPAPPALWLHLDRAHLLLNAGGASFKDNAMRQFLLGLQMAYGAHLPIVLELRERPGQGLLGAAAHEIEVPGLDRIAMGEMLAAHAPEGMDWRYSGDKLKRIYGWIGASGGKTAHPLTLTLLIQVARGKKQSPEQVLDHHSDDLKLALEERLLNDLYHNVLNDNEQVMFATLALYRAAIPHDHADWLEAKLDLAGAWDGLLRRFLLSADAKGQEFFVHGFIVEWLRKQQGYAMHSEDGEAVWEEQDPLRLALVQRRHLAIAECWLQQLGGRKRHTQLNIERALEAFYHLLEANEGGQIHGIAVELLSGKLDWATKKIKKFYEYLFQSSAPIKEQMKALEYWRHLDPQEPRAWAFLGECHVKLDGWGSDEALRCFEEACVLRPNYPNQWANLGRALRARGPTGAQEFLTRLEVVERDYPQAINNHVRAIQADCLVATGQIAQARRQRQQAIQMGTADIAFYAAEATASLAENKPLAAIAVLDKARQLGISDDYTEAIYANALETNGDAEKALALRAAKIAQNSPNE